jgi:hypothetical protein
MNEEQFNYISKHYDIPHTADRLYVVQDIDNYISSYSKNTDIDKIIRDIDFTMSMEDMPLTPQDKQRLYDCITGKLDIEQVIQQTIKNTQ